MDHQQAFELLKQYVKQDSMLKHSLASEAVMQAIARRLVRDEANWGLAGLLHDIDVEVTNADSMTHGQVSIDILKPLGVDAEVIEAISMHNECSAKEPRSKEFHYALCRRNDYRFDYRHNSCVSRQEDCRSKAEICCKADEGKEFCCLSKAREYYGM